MTPLREKMIADMRLRNLSERTRASYVCFVRVFSRFHGRSPAELGADEVRAFLLHLEAEGRSPSTRNVYWAALRFLYVETLGRPDVFATIPRVRMRSRRDPTALTREETRRLLTELSSRPFDYTFFATLLGTGLRISEARYLQVGDVDAAAGLLHVRRGKGGRPRSVMLTRRHLQLLRRYWQVERPPGPWLFPAQRLAAPGVIDPDRRWSDHPVSNDTMGARFRAAASRAGLKRRVTPHDLRRTFATWLLEDGVDLRTVQVLLGHGCASTTARYMAVNPSLIRRTSSALDLLTAR